MFPPDESTLRSLLFKYSKPLETSVNHETDVFSFTKSWGYMSSPIRKIFLLILFYLQQLYWVSPFEFSSATFDLLTGMKLVSLFYYFVYQLLDGIFMIKILFLLLFSHKQNVFLLRRLQRSRWLRLHLFFRVTDLCHNSNPIKIDIKN